MGDEEGVFVARFAIGEGRVVIEADHLTARATQHSIACGGIPFHRAAEPGVEIGLARGDKAEALKAYDAVAGEGNAMPALREVAQLQAGLLAVDLEGFAEVESRLSSLAAAGNPLRHSAREALAIAALKAGEDQKALEWLTRIMEDSQAVGGVQSRAGLLLDLLAGKGVKAAG